MNFNTLFENRYVIAAVFGILMSLSELALIKKNQLYDPKNVEQMKIHVLNTRYRFNERKGLDIQYINRTIGYFHIGVAAVAAICLIFNYILGAAVYFIGYIAINYVAYAYINKELTKDGKQ